MDMAQRAKMYCLEATVASLTDRLNKITEEYAYLQAKLDAAIEELKTRIDTIEEMPIDIDFDDGIIEIIEDEDLPN
jgi:chromosome segregation ATPase